MQTIKLIGLYLGVFVGVILFVWGAAILFAEGVSDHKVVQPEPGIKCVVVSRMFNTSVDCWEDK